LTEQAWSIKDLLYGIKYQNMINFPCGTKPVSRVGKIAQLKVNVKNISNREILLGMPGCEDEFFVNHVILIAKHYLFSCRCKNTYPLVNVFTARLKKIQDLELLIAKSKSNLSNYTAKWGKFLINIDL